MFFIKKENAKALFITSITLPFYPFSSQYIKILFTIFPPHALIRTPLFMFYVRRKWLKWQSDQTALALKGQKTDLKGNLPFKPATFIYFSIHSVWKVPSLSIR